MKMRKSILLIAPKFFSYENEIKKELEKQGFQVDYFDERFGNNSLNKVIIRLKPPFIFNYLSKKYYKEIQKNVLNKEYEYIFFINAETIIEESLLNLKEIHKKGKFVLYMWDSFKNKKQTLTLIKYFDKVLTFDKEDLKYNKKIEFLPLFYIDKFKKNQELEEKYILSFIGTLHSDRAQILKKLKLKLEEKKISYYFYLYYQSRIILKIRKFLLDKNLRNIDLHSIIYKKLTFEKINEINSSSRIILDIENINQTGLTMRTIEVVLGMRKKLITTNKSIKKYDFYNENNILVINRDEPKIEEKFLESNYEELDERIYKKYSIDSWIKKILEKDKNEQI